MARSLATGSLDFGDHIVETILIAAAAQGNVIAILRKALADMTANAGACPDDHANVGHIACLYIIISETD